MYNETQIIQLMTLRQRRWTLLSDSNDLSESQIRTQLNKVNKSLYKLTGKRQYL
jgi:hypothetical protein